MRISVLGQASTLAVVAALCADAAHAQEQQAQAPAPLIYSQSGGLLMMSLPDLPSGVVDSGGPVAGSGSKVIPGMMVGLDLGRNLGRFGDMDIVGNLSFFIGTGNDTTTSQTVLSGQGTIQFSANAPSTATIALSTDPAGVTATTDVTLALPGGGAINTQSATSAPGGGSQVLYGVVLTGDNTGAVFGGVATNGATGAASAFGAAADPSGFTFLGTGDLTGMRITSEVFRSFAYMGADASIGLSPPSINALSFTPYLSVGYRLLNQEIGSRTTFDLPEPAGATPFPLLGLQRVEHLDTNYYGGGVGLAVSHTLDNGITLSGAAEAGLRAFDASYSGRDLAIFPINNGGLETQRFDVGRASADEHGVAWFAKGEAGFNFPLAPNLLLGFTGSVEYLSKVPALARTAPDVQVSQAGGVTNVNFGGGANAQGTSIVFTDSWNFGLKATLSGAF